MATPKKDLYTGPIAQDERGNFYCGAYLLDYKTVVSKFKLGDIVTIKSVIDNTSDLSYNDYPKKSKNFVMAKEVQ